MIQFSNGRTRSDALDVPRLPDPSSLRRSNPSKTRQSVEEWIGEHPVASVAAALILGAALGWIIKRR